MSADASTLLCKVQFRTPLSEMSIDTFAHFDRSPRNSRNSNGAKCSSHTIAALHYLVSHAVSVVMRRTPDCTCRAFRLCPLFGISHRHQKIKRNAIEPSSKLAQPIEMTELRTIRMRRLRVSCACAAHGNECEWEVYDHEEVVLLKDAGQCVFVRRTDCIGRNTHIAPRMHGTERRRPRVIETMIAPCHTIMTDQIIYLTFFSVCCALRRHSLRG